MIAFALGMLVGALIGAIVCAWIYAMHDADEWGEQMNAMRRMQGPHDWSKDGSDL